MEATRFCTILLVSFLFPATLFADVITPGPSDPTLFTSVINLPGDPTPVDSGTGVGSIGGTPGQTTQVNVGNGGSLSGLAISVAEGGELNVIGGSASGFFVAVDGGGELNLISGTVSSLLFTANDGSQVNISGGTINGAVGAQAGSEFNLFGSEFFLNGSPLTGLNSGEAFTINDRNVTLSGLLDDGSAFSFDLNSEFIDGDNDEFSPAAKLTVTLTAVPEPTSMAILLLGFGMASMRRKRAAA